MFADFFNHRLQTALTNDPIMSARFLGVAPQLSSVVKLARQQAIPKRARKFEVVRPAAGSGRSK
jgi:hypothetical protein